MEVRSCSWVTYNRIKKKKKKKKKKKVNKNNAFRDRPPIKVR